MTGKRGGEEGEEGERGEGGEEGEGGERGGVEKEEVVLLAARQKSFLHGAAPEIFKQPIHLVHEKID